MRKGVSDDWNNLNKRWVPGVWLSSWGNISKSPFRETGFGPATVSLGTSGEFKLSFLPLLDGEQGKHIFFNFQKQKNISPDALKVKAQGRELWDPREMKSRGKAYLQTLFPISVSAWINSFNKRHIHEHGTEKNMCYILTVEMWVWESIFLPVYLKEKSLHSNFINCKGKRKEK